MKTIKININPESATGEAFRNYLDEKAALKKAVKSGNINSFAKTYGKKFDTPISVLGVNM